jgi:hypothetical protein
MMFHSTHLNPIHRSLADGPGEAFSFFFVHRTPLAFLLSACYDGDIMTHVVTPIDMSNNPELLRLAEEVAATKTPRTLTRHNKTVAMLMPVGAAVQRSHPQKRTIWTHYDPKRVRAALKTSAGALQGVNRGELFSDLANQRRQESTGRHF